MKNDDVRYGGPQSMQPPLRPAWRVRRGRGRPPPAIARGHRWTEPSRAVDDRGGLSSPAVGHPIAAAPRHGCRRPPSPSEPLGARIDGHHAAVARLGPLPSTRVERLGADHARRSLPVDQRHRFSEAPRTTEQPPRTTHHPRLGLAIGMNPHAVEFVAHGPQLERDSPTPLATGQGDHHRARASAMPGGVVLQHQGTGSFENLSVGKPRRSRERPPSAAWPARPRVRARSSRWRRPVAVGHRSPPSSSAMRSRAPPPRRSAKTQAPHRTRPRTRAPQQGPVGARPAPTPDGPLPSSPVQAGKR